MGITGAASGEYESGVVAVSSKIMLAAIVVLFVVVLFIVLLHIYARCCWRRRLRLRDRSRRRNIDMILAEDSQNRALRPAGLDPELIEKLPVFIYTSQEHPGGPLECSVCLCEFEEKEKGRTLPKCNHSFHIDCIDMWFASHSTCPLCRASALPDAKETTVESPAAQTLPSLTQQEETGVSVEIREASEGLPSPANSTNILFWGTENAVATASPSVSSPSASFVSMEKMVIEVPRRESFSSRFLSLSPRTDAGDDAKPPTPSRRLRSFKRLLSRDKKSTGPPASPDGTSTLSLREQSSSGPPV